MEIRALKGEQLAVTTEWVKAHQDTKYPVRHLSAPAQINGMADTDASHYMNMGFNSNTTPPILPTLAATLTVNGMVVTSNMQEILQDASCCADIRAYIQKKIGWSFDMMEWVQ
eukprot:1523227-Ditylum_brightwellii.AAC.1